MQQPTKEKRRREKNRAAVDYREEKKQIIS